MQTWPNFGFTVAYTGGGGGGGVIAIDVQAARLSGVAPLYVNFDATGTTSSATSNPNQDIFYGWDFGDTGAGTWANGVQTTGLNDKNSDFGVIAGHVFETPGTYTVTMACTDGTNSGSTTKTITVLNPDTVYSGTATVCLSRTTDTTGSPAGATLVTNCALDITSLLATHMTANKRVMLRAGQSFELSGSTAFSWNANGMTLTKFGSGAAPSIAVKATASTYTFGSGVTDARLFDIDHAVDATASGTKIVSTIATTTQVTIMRIGCSGLSSGIGFSINAGDGITKHDDHDQFCLQECVTTGRTDAGYSGVSAYIGLIRGSIMGNNFDNNTFGEQTLRIHTMRNSSVTHNTLKRCNDNKAILKIHGYNKDSWNVPSEKFVVSSNILDHRSGKNVADPMCTFSTGDGANREVTGAAIFENNIGYTKVDGTAGGTMFDVSSPGCIIRNNLFNATLGTPSNAYKDVKLLGTNSGIVGVQTTGVRVFNNTMYSNAFSNSGIDEAGSHQMVALVNVTDRGDLSTTYGTIEVRNNLHYSTTAAVTAANAASVLNQSTTAVVTKSNNTSDVTDYRTNPNFTATPPVNYTDWKPTSGYAINGGVSVPVVKDFLNVTRTGTFDIGALQP